MATRLKLIYSLQFSKVELQILRTGLIPIKKSLGASIEWIHCDREVAQKLLKQDNLMAVERMLIDLGDDVAKGLGCSICKGPPDRPGIYVQSIKVGCVISGELHGKGRNISTEFYVYSCFKGQRSGLQVRPSARRPNPHLQ